MRRLPEYAYEVVPIPPMLLDRPGVRVGWFSGTMRVIGTTLSPAHWIGGDALEGVPAKLVVDVKVESANGTSMIVPNMDVHAVFDAEERPER